MWWSWVAISTVVPGAVDPLEQIHDVLAGLRIQVSGRLVGQQHQRPVDERAGDGDALLLTAGQLGGQSVGLAGQPHHLQHVGHHPVDHVGALADHLEGEGHVLEHRLLLQQAEVLEHAADHLTQAGDVAAGQLVDVELRHPDIAGVGVSSASSSRMNVDLPDPDGPMRKTNSPFSILSEMLSRAGRADDLYCLLTRGRG